MDFLSFHEKQHLLRLLNQQGQIKYIFDDFTRKASAILTKWKQLNTDSVWIRNAALEKQVDRLLNDLHDKLLDNIENYTSKSWEAANLKTDNLIKLYIKDLALSELIGKDRYQSLELGMFARNMEALKAFQERTIKGLNLSARIWSTVNGVKDNIEFYLSSGIATGRPAVKIAQDIRQLMQNPNKRFRRLRNEEGKLILSKPMKDYHPGQGQYRSSYKNALRLAATETNQAYRSADHERWKNQKFVLGIEVHRSKSNKGPCAVCDAMVGQYPKDYKFVGNHPFCICFSVPIMLEGQDFVDYLLSGKVSEGKRIKTIPQSALQFVNGNKKHLDYLYVKENEKYYLK